MNVFLAGTDQRPQVRKECIFALDSFYYVDANKPSDHRQFQDYLLDSGAFTMMSGNGGGKPLDEYVERFADYIAKNDIKNYFELDIDTLVGYDKVLKIREYLEKKTDRPCIPVWHTFRGKQNFVDMCKRYNYVAIGGFAISKGAIKFFDYLPNLVNEAHRHHTRIHGLGITKMKILKAIPFDSVDSTSWLSGARYGVFSKFVGDGIQLRQHKNGERAIISSIDNQIVNGLEWCKFQRYAKEHL